MSPPVFLLSVCGLTLLAWCAWWATSSMRRRQLRQLARQWHMHYSQHDPFHLADRLRAVFPVPGAADLRVSHVIYALHEGRYQWLLTVDYTQGVLRMQHRVRRAATFCEPHEAAEGRGCSEILLADAQLPLLQQYQELHQQLSGGLPPAHSSPGPEPSRMKTSR